MLPTGTVTFLFTDIQGSTPLWEREPGKMAEALQVHNAVLRQAVSDHGGFVFKVVGDAFQCAFANASQALKAAIAGQFALQSAAWNELGALRVRMGLHTGEGELDPNGDEFAVSHTKNRVARIMSVAQGGQILLSLATAELLRGHLPAQVTLQDLGNHLMKGMSQPEHIFQVVATGLPGEFPAISTQALPLPVRSNPLNEIRAKATAETPAIDSSYLDQAVYSRLLTEREQQEYIHLLAFARKLQADQPAYEAAYRHLAHLFVLNGSRIEQLIAIDRRLRGLAEGQGALMLVAGVSGIGKTSLVMAFQERIEQLGGAIITGRCLEQERSSYAPWQEVVRGAAAASEKSIHTLLSPIGNGLHAQSARQLRSAVRDWLESCAAVKPLVIMLDDLHWADGDSLELLESVTAGSTQASILFIATYRSEEAHRHTPLDDYLPRLRRNRTVDYLQLQPLSREDIDRLVTASRGPGSPQLSEYLLQRATGHPLFTLELLNDLVEQGLVNKDEDGKWLPPEKSVPVPAYLRQLISQKVNRLGEAVEQLLSAGAVVGKSWSLDIVEHLLELPEEDLLAALEEALRGEVIQVEDEAAERYCFAHGMIREVMYSGQLTRRRRRLHARVVAFMVERGSDEIYSLAYHAIEAELWEKAAEYCLAAGDQAVQRFAHLSARQWYQKGLDATQRVVSQQAPVVELNLYERLGRTTMALGQPQEAEGVYKRMSELARNRGEVISEGIALANLAQVYARNYQPDLAEATALEALKIAQQCGDLHLLTHIHGSLAVMQIYRGQPDRATSHMAEALANIAHLQDRTLESEVYRWYAYTKTWAGDYATAEKFAQHSFERARETIDPLVIAGGYQNLGYAQIEGGKYLQAYNNLRTILEAGEISADHHHNLPRLLNLMGYLHLELGDARRALEWDLRAYQASLRGNFEMRRYSLLNMATDYLHLGELEQAWETIARFEGVQEHAEYIRFRYYNRYLLLLSELYLVEKNHPRSIELAQEARQMAQSSGIPKNVAKSLWFEGQSLAGAGSTGEAIEKLDRAVTLADSIEHGSLRWKIRLSLAEALLQSGSSAVPVIQAARQLVERTAHSLAGSPLQEPLLTSAWIGQLERLEQAPATGKPAYPAGLTEREIQVLRLVASGATNQRVAEHLVISVRTVNTHMTSILKKTGCENRTAASAWAIQHNLVSK